MTDEKPLSEKKNTVYLKVEFDSLDDIMEPEILEVLLNILDEKCSETVGIKNGPQFHRINKEKIESAGSEVKRLQDEIKRVIDDNVVPLMSRASVVEARLSKAQEPTKLWLGKWGIILRVKFKDAIDELEEALK